jgi:hypothetical protein
MSAGVSIDCPVIVHRWFKDGEGWAYHPSLSPDSSFSNRFNTILSSREGLPCSGWLSDTSGEWFYYHEEDPQPPDPKAQGRQPTIFRAVLLPRRPKDPTSDQQIEDLLTHIPIPEQPGPCPDLVLSLPQEWFSPEPPKKRKPLLLLLGGFILVLVSAAIVIAISYPRTIPPEDVWKRLLQPLGVTPGAMRGKILEAFRQHYCQKGMREKFWGPDWARVRDALQKKAENKEPHAPLHPDEQFLHERSAEIEKIYSEFEETVQLLPKQPVEPQEKLPDLPNDILTRMVIKVAKDIPEKKRPPEMPDNTVTATTAVPILKHAIVSPLIKWQENWQKWKSNNSYERWFAAQDLWQAGQKFPWDTSPDAGVRSLAKSFWEHREFSERGEEAAQAMYEWLRHRGVEGIQEEDCQERPWFIGRCFVEFLSLKHFSEDERKQYGEEKSVMWEKFLKKLPEEGWKKGPEAADGQKLWETVEEKLRDLARRLGIVPENSPKETVKLIVGELKRWPGELKTQQKEWEKEKASRDAKEKELQEKKEELKRIQKEKDTKEEERKKTEGEMRNFRSSDSEYKQLSKKRDELLSTLKRLRTQEKKLQDAIQDLEKQIERPSQLPSIKKSRYNRLQEFWDRLTKDVGEPKQPEKKNKGS